MLLRASWALPSRLSLRRRQQLRQRPAGAVAAQRMRPCQTLQGRSNLRRRLHCHLPGSRRRHRSSRSALRPQLQPLCQR